MRPSDLFQGLGKLPPFPPAALQLLSITTESETALEDCDRVFRSDPASAMELLAIANSAEFGLRATVDSVRHAVALLGLERVKSVAFTLAMRLYLGRHSPRMALVEGVWAHSLATAVIAETLGIVDGLPGEVLYTAGLVHDVGRLGLLICEKSAYSQILQAEVSTMEESLSAEKELLDGLTHQEIGGLLAEKWNIPAKFQACIRYHHGGLEEPQADPHLRVIRQACQAAGRIGYGELMHHPLQTMPDGDNASERLLPNLHLTSEALRVRIKGVVEKVCLANG
jgi:HD-like signal output (HDOD) protein